MERALDPELLRLALGDLPRLPTAEELAAAMADIEVQLILTGGDFDDALLGTAWFLHAVAASPDSGSRYGLERRRAAYQVSGHVFDLRLASGDLSEDEQRRYCFAAQTAFLGSELDPNTLAIYRRSFPTGINLPSVLEDTAGLALGLAVMLLGGDYGPLFPTTTQVLQQLRSLELEWGVEGLDGTGLGSALGVAEACRHLVVFLTYGRTDRLEQARASLERVLLLPRGSGELTIHWVASHLLDIADHMESSSVWTGLPPTVPRGVRSAFAMGEPRTPTLWPPQLDLLGASADREGPSCLSDEVRRSFISTPTSGGKTLLAQLIISDYLARHDDAACYVAPTRSLCNEVRRVLNGRLRYVGTAVQHDLPFWEALGAPDPGGPRVEVMTPERLSFLLRSGAGSVLGRFGLFVFDEVHMVGEGDRGWTLESVLSYLHARTLTTTHRIVCMSAAIGNRAHFTQWLDGAGAPYSYHRDWRGPRRVHCLWSTTADWQSPSDLPTRSLRFPTRRGYPLYGRLSIRAGGIGVKTYVTSNPVGELVMEYGPGNSRNRHQSSTPFYRTLAELIAHLCELGPVLVIEATRRQALRTANAVAEQLEVDTAEHTRALRDLISARLTGDHPLSDMVRRGVAYHHGSLPLEIRAVIEESVGAGLLKCLVATPTMTEGVNLPVRSVVIGSTGTYQTGGTFHDYITGPKLVNALGRAGRAGIETEGVLVLAVTERVSESHFDLLTPDDDDLHVRSLLADSAALDYLAGFEATIGEAQDRVIESARGSVGLFMSFVWFVALELERLMAPVTAAAVEEVLQRSLAWVQLEDGDRDRWLGVMAASVGTYLSMPERRRARWASSGGRPPSTQLLEAMADELVEELLQAGSVESPIEAVSLLLTEGRQGVFSAMEEFPNRRFRVSSGGPRRDLDVNLRDVCLDWVGGTELHDIAEKYLAAVTDLDFRFEQLSDYLNDYFEVFLPWVFGVLVQWVVNPTDTDTSLLPPGLPSFVRYGVGDPVAVQLMQEGIQSRRLAMSVAAAWAEADTEVSIRDWLGALDQLRWQELFDASVADMRSLLEFARPYDAGFLSEVLSGDEASLTVACFMEEYAREEATVLTGMSEDTALVWVECKGERVAQVTGRDHLDVLSFLRANLPHSASFEAVAGQGTLTVQLSIPEG